MPPKLLNPKERQNKMNVLNLFKTYTQRVPKKAVEALGEENVPEETFTVVSLKGTETGMRTKDSLTATADELVDALETLVTKVSDGLSAGGHDTALIDEIPDLSVVRAKLKERMDPEALLRSAFRDANNELFLAKYPAIAAAVAPEKKESSRGGPAIKLDF
jgi:methionine synthase I (cobalamin-dependent)